MMRVSKLATGLMILLFSLSLQAKQIMVDPAMNVQSIIDAASSGDTVYFSHGLYKINLIIVNSVLLRADKDVVLDGQGAGNIITIKANNVLVENFTLKNSGMNLTDMNAAVFVEKTAHNVIIKNNVFINNLFGVFLDACKDAKVLGNKISADISVRSQSRGNGIHLFNTKDAEISDNEVWHTRDGIYIEASHHNFLKSNYLHDLRYGIHYMYSHDNEVINNVTRNTRTGYALMQSRSLKVEGNVSDNDQNYGILLNFITYSKINNNKIKHVRKGTSPGTSGQGIAGAEGKSIFIYNSLFNEISKNDFMDSDIGIHLTAGSENNKIFSNNFMANQVQVKYVANRKQEWSLNGDGNYWSNYLGWDRDNDGIGDRVFEPNDSIDKLLWKYPLAKLLMNSPSVQILRWSQTQFPVFKSPGVKDSFPLMQPVKRGINDERMSELL
jgi:nitrous oxidase accessory protein